MHHKCFRIKVVNWCILFLQIPISKTISQLFITDFSACVLSVAERCSSTIVALAQLQHARTFGLSTTEEPIVDLPNCHAGLALIFTTARGNFVIERFSTETVKEARQLALH